MIMFSCPSCKRSFVLNIEEVEKTSYFACDACNRIVPNDLIAPLKKVCRHFPKEERTNRKNTDNWIIRIYTN